MFRCAARFDDKALSLKGYTRKARQVQRQRIERLVQMADAETRWRVCHDIAIRRRMDENPNMTEEDVVKFAKIDQVVMGLQKDYRKIEWYGQDKFHYEYITRFFALKGKEEE